MYSVSSDDYTQVTGDMPTALADTACVLDSPNDKVVCVGGTTDAEAFA